MGKKYYAVKKGREKGIYETWEACKEQVNGFKGAEYKSFSNLQDAEEYLNKNSNVNESSKFIDGLIAYIDGSYDNNIKEYGSGIYITDGENEKLIKFKGNDERFLDNNNVAGELMACVYVMNYCLKNNIKDVNICYDYEGIAKWANGTWQTKKTLTKLYKQFIDSVKDRININFVKVQAHSGDKGNNIADNLAKEALKEHNLQNPFENYNLEQEEENKSFTIKFFEKQNMEKLKNFMKEEKFDITIIEDLPNNIEESFYISSKVSKLKLRFNYYTNRTLTIQGKALDVFNSVQLFLSEYIKNYKELLKENEEFLSYDVNDVYSELVNNIMPTSFNDFNEDIQNLLITAYGITKLRYYDFIIDYSFYQIPIARCLEYFLKFIFSNYGISFQAKEDRKAYIYNNFRMFKRDGKLNEYILFDLKCKSKINNLEVVNSLERCYNFYQERNSFVHANITRSGTTIISDKSIADKFTLEGLSLIEDEYKKIRKYLN